jgi:Leucine-rich repeat (LRR) protein
MQVNRSDEARFSLPLMSIEQTNCSILPLHGYPPTVGIPTFALPLPTLTIATLPKNSISTVQSLCSHQDLLALTAVDKAAFAQRFDNPPLQHLHFSAAPQVTAFLRCCQETQQTAKLNGTIRSREHFQTVHSLTLTLSDQLNIEQCISLFAFVPGVTCLKINLTDEQRLISLAPLLEAARYLALKHLYIAGSPKISFSLSYRFEEDPVPNRVWQWGTLETLSIVNFIGTWRIPDEIGNLAQLTSLRIKVKCGGVQQAIPFPESMGQLTQLESLILEGFLGVRALPEAIGQLRALKTLELTEVSIRALPASVWRLPRLEQLSLDRLLFEKLPDEIGQFPALKSLALKNMGFRELPKSLGQLTKLEQLIVEKLYYLQEIPAEIGQLRALKSLTLNQIFLPKTLPASVGQLDKLEVLTLRDLNHLESLPDEIGQLTALHSLNLSSMRSLRALPTSLAQLPNLRKITLSIMPDLTIPLALPKYTIKEHSPMKNFTD